MPMPDTIDASDFSIVLPALNEEEGLRLLLPELRERYPEAEIIVVDDGSEDGTSETALDLGAKVVSHPYRKGNGAAVKSGIRAATRRFVVLMDADGQHNPAEVGDFFEPLKQFDLVVGARIEDRTSPIHRKIANRLYNRFATYLTQIPILDLTSGFRALSRKLALQFCYLLPNTYSYPSTLTLAVVRAGYSVKYVPIQVRKRIGRSKISLFRDGIMFLLIMIKVIMLFAPLRVFLPISGLCLVAGVTYGGYMIWFNHHFSPATLFLLITSLLTFLMGLIGEQIAQLWLVRIDEETPRIREKE
jgi:glycosyltransferase involved in cell wall biosynthesis